MVSYLSICPGERSGIGQQMIYTLPNAREGQGLNT